MCLLYTFKVNWRNMSLNATMRSGDVFLIIFGQQWTGIKVLHRYDQLNCREVKYRSVDLKGKSKAGVGSCVLSVRCNMDYSKGKQTVYNPNANIQANKPRVRRHTCLFLCFMHTIDYANYTSTLPPSKLLLMLTILMRGRSGIILLIKKKDKHHECDLWEQQSGKTVLCHLQVWCCQLEIYKSSEPKWVVFKVFSIFLVLYCTSYSENKCMIKVSIYCNTGINTHSGSLKAFTGWPQHSPRSWQGSHTWQFNYTHTRSWLGSGLLSPC